MDTPFGSHIGGVSLRDRPNRPKCPTPDRKRGHPYSLQPREVVAYSTGTWSRKAHILLIVNIDCCGGADDVKETRFEALWHGATSEIEPPRT